ncbi:uncharacterized protein G2W53_027286 [Senna tora]|uniref:Uncharacterized protein n=1 Tax=Senna tora TaxID=362788 RepID=A0A834TJ32_9FABA|nr:uncharacterized protein G2W53_027286 [Senna tora]
MELGPSLVVVLVLRIMEGEREEQERQTETPEVIRRARQGRVAMESRLQANLAGRKMRDLIKETGKNNDEILGTNQRKGDEEFDHLLTDQQALGTEEHISEHGTGKLYESWANEMEAQEIER